MKTRYSSAAHVQPKTDQNLDIAPGWANRVVPAGPYGTGTPRNPLGRKKNGGRGGAVPSPTHTQPTRGWQLASFHDRLVALGFLSYDDYLASDHWQAFRLSYKSSRLPTKCAVCGFGPIQLHHHTYQRLGAERLGDVTPLCRPHHVEVHKWLKAHDLLVSATGRAIRSLRVFDRHEARQAAAESRGGTIQPKAKTARRERMAAEYRRLKAAGAEHPAVSNGINPDTSDVGELARAVRLLSRALSGHRKKKQMPVPCKRPAQSRRDLRAIRKQVEKAKKAEAHARHMAEDKARSQRLRDLREYQAKHRRLANPELLAKFLEASRARAGRDLRERGLGVREDLHQGGKPLTAAGESSVVDVPDGREAGGGA